MKRGQNRTITGQNEKENWIFRAVEINGNRIESKPKNISYEPRKYADTYYAVKIPFYTLNRNTYPDCCEPARVCLWGNEKSKVEVAVRNVSK